MLGLALDLFLRVRVEGDANATGPHIVALGGEASALPADRSNAWLRAFEAAWNRWGQGPMPGLAVSLDSEIPVGRGLGSSGASVAAGMLCALQVAGVNPETARPALLELGTELESHPDNVVASLLGGCTLALSTAEGPRVLRPAVHSDLGFAIAWGATPLPTPVARALLPEQIPFEQALDQPRRLAALLEGLRSGDEGLLRHAQTEYLHSTQRLARIAGGPDALHAAQAAGAWLATVSGSGSALLAIGPTDHAPTIAQAMGAVLQASDAPAAHRVVKLETSGARFA